MGKAEIVGGGTDGLYTVRVLHNKTRILSEIARLEALISEIEDLLTEEQPKLSEAESDLDAAKAELDSAIAALSAGTGTMDDVQQATQEALAARNAVTAVEIRIALYEARKGSAQSKITRLQAAADDAPEVSAWCCDLTESLSGQVSTIEIAGQRNGADILVRPGYSDAAAHACSRDGQLQQAIGGTPAAVYFNQAVLPWWQKYRPTYRLGTISSIDTVANTCTVDLDSATSSAQNIDVNPVETLTDVPVEYMDCHAIAFEIGDRVVVQFNDQDWTQPTVIGFEQQPKTCYTPGIIVLPYSASCPSGWGYPWVDDDGNPINSGLGTCGGERPEALYTEGGDMRLHTAMVTAEHYWVSATDEIVATGTRSSHLSFTPTADVYWRGQHYPAPQPALGAAVSGDVLIAICERPDTKRVEIFGYVDKSWSLLTTYDPPAGATTNGWFFSDSGTGARAVYTQDNGDGTQSFTIATAAISEGPSASVSAQGTAYEGVYYDTVQSEDTVEGEYDLSYSGSFVCSWGEYSHIDYEADDPTYGECYPKSTSFRISQNKGLAIAHCPDDLEEARDQQIEDQRNYVENVLAPSDPDYYWTFLRVELDEITDVYDTLPSFSQFFTTYPETTEEYLIYTRATANVVFEKENKSSGSTSEEFIGVFAVRRYNRRVALDNSESTVLTTDISTPGGSSLFYAGYNGSAEVDIVATAVEPFSGQSQDIHTEGGYRIVTWPLKDELVCVDGQKVSMITGLGGTFLHSYDQVAEFSDLDVEIPSDIGGYDLLENGSSLFADDPDETPHIWYYDPNNRVMVRQDLQSDTPTVYSDGVRLAEVDFTASIPEYDTDGFLALREQMSDGAVAVDASGTAHISIGSGSASVDPDGTVWHIDDHVDLVGLPDAVTVIGRA